MSCYVLKSESIENIAASIAAAQNYPNNNINVYFNNDFKFRAAYKPSRDKYGYLKPEKLAAALYKMNVDAYNQRYKEADDEFIPVFKEGENLLKNATDERLARLIKTLDCFIYQCAEGDIPETDLYKAVDDFRRRAYEYFVQRTAAYEAAVWG